MTNDTEPGTRFSLLEVDPPAQTRPCPICGTSAALDAEGHFIGHMDAMRRICRPSVKVDLTTAPRPSLEDQIAATLSAYVAPTDYSRANVERAMYDAMVRAGVKGEPTETIHVLNGALDKAWTPKPTAWDLEKAEAKARWSESPAAQMPPTVYRIRTCPLCATETTLGEDGKFAPHHTARGTICDAMIRVQVPEDSRLGRALNSRVTQAEDLVAVSSATESTGAITYWSMSGDLDLPKLRQAWLLEGLPEEWLPALPSAASAFTRAAKAEQTTNCMVRRHPGGGYQFTFESMVREDQPMKYEAGPRLVLTHNTFPDGSMEDPRVDLFQDDGAQHEAAQRLLDKVRASFVQKARTIETGDVGPWLTWLTRKLSAVSLRATGGVYFIPKDGVDRWHKVKACLKSASSHRVFEIPALKSADTVAAVLDGLATEVDQICTDVRWEVEAGEIGTRAAKSRRDNLAALRQKVEGYERLLSTPMGGTKQRIEFLDKLLSNYTPRGSMLEVE